MNLDPGDLVRAAPIGGGATLLMDAWNLFLKRAFGIPSLDYGLLGRWVLHMPEGRFRHDKIAAAARKPGERVAGWMAHYATGIGFSALFVAAIAPSDWLSRPTPLPALLYGILTVVFPLFVLQPALGLGVASSRAAQPMQARLKSLGTHVVFGLGLYACALVSSALGRPA